MRLKKYTGETLQEAMSRVRDDLGVDAIILNVSDSVNGHICVTAAIEKTEVISGVSSDINSAPPIAQSSEFDSASLAATLRYHGIPKSLATHIETTASAIDAPTLIDGLAHGLDTLINFQPIGLSQARPIILIGPPGAGKTLTIAKIAASALSSGSTVRLINMDTVRAGAQAQLEHYGRLMKLRVSTAETPEELQQQVEHDTTSEGLTLIDTVGVNPYSLQDAQMLAHIMKLSNAEPVLVLPAGLDCVEAAELAAIFKSLGTSRMIVTRLDATKRYASLLTAMYKGQLSLAALASGPYVANGLLSPNALELARLIIAKPDPARLKNLKKAKVAQ